MSKLSEQVALHLSVDFSAKDSIDIFGYHDKNLRLIEDYFSVSIVVADNCLKIKGPEEAIYLVEKLLRFIASAEGALEENELKYYARLLKKNPDFDLAFVLKRSLKVSKQGKIVRSRGLGQGRYLDAIAEKHVVFGIGPAGTGKTYLAMAYAISKLIKDEVNRIVLVRPVVEAGESLGFLPGDLTQKIDPYLRPLYDAAHEMVGYEDFIEYAEKGRIEVVPLAYMRGRTLNDSIIILDEAQNTTATQMKMFLTRLGVGSTAIITGDITQVDLPNSKTSGLKHAMKILRNIEGVAFVHFTRDDVVRHKLVQQIIDAYEKHENAHAQTKTQKKSRGKSADA